MKVLFDHQAFSIQSYGGVSRYFSELISHFNSAKDISYDLSVKYSSNIYLKTLKASTVNFPPSQFRGRSTLLHFLNKQKSAIKIKKEEYDLFHPTYYHPYFLKYIVNKPFILTVHDMTHELYPDKVNRWDKSASYKEILVRKASKIICVSENTKKDLCRLLGVEERKVAVVYLASSLMKNKELKDDSLPSKYILYVGTRGYYKNFTSLFKAVEQILRDDKEIFMVCAGGGKFNEEELKQFSESGVREKIIYKNVNDDYLSLLYTNAKLFVLPSLYEGFGIPLLEAFNCDCPVITSNVSSLPEVAGDAAYYINPEDIKMIGNAVSKLLYNDNLRFKLIENGKIQREKFSWNKTALATINLYKSIVYQDFNR